MHFASITIEGNLQPTRNRKLCNILETNETNIPCEKFGYSYPGQQICVKCSTTDYCYCKSRARSACFLVYTDVRKKFTVCLDSHRLSQGFPVVSWFSLPPGTTIYSQANIKGKTKVGQVLVSSDYPQKDHRKPIQLGRSSRPSSTCVNILKRKASYRFAVD